MAKDQNLNLNSLKISGMCGRLLCCLGAEYETYKELSANFPVVGTEIMCGSLVFTVIAGDVLKQTLKIKDKDRFFFFYRTDLENEGGAFFIKKEVLDRIAAVDEQAQDDDDSYYAVDVNSKHTRKL
jgi:cell fate regulator YaaT (PSP1 superfamily)